MLTGSLARGLLDSNWERVSLRPIKISNDVREKKMAHDRVDHDTSSRRSEERSRHPEEGEEGEVSSFDQWLDEVTEAADRYFSDRLP